MGSVTTGRVRPAEQPGVELPVPIRVTEYRLRHGHSQPMAVGGTRVVGSGMRVGRPAGGSPWPPRTHYPGAARPARRVVVGYLGYDVSFTRPKSCSLLLALADSDTAAAVAVEAVYTEAVGRTFGWLERVRQARRVDRDAAHRPGVRPRGGVPGGAAGGRAAHPGGEDRGGRGPGRHPARALAGRGPRRRLGPGAIARRVLAGGGPDGADGADGRRDPDHGPPAAGPQSVAALAGPAREARAGWSTRATSGGPSPRHSPSATSAAKGLGTASGWVAAGISQTDRAVGV